MLYLDSLLGAQSATCDLCQYFLFFSCFDMSVAKSFCCTISCQPPKKKKIRKSFFSQQMLTWFLFVFNFPEILWRQTTPELFFFFLTIQIDRHATNYETKCFLLPKRSAMLSKLLLTAFYCILTKVEAKVSLVYQNFPASNRTEFFWSDYVTRNWHVTLDN